MTSPVAVLALHSLRRMRPIVAGMAVVLGGFQFLLTQVASYLFRSGGFSLIPSLVPDFFRQLAGDSMLTFMSFEGILAFGYFHPAVIASHIGLAIAIATEPATEVETRFADLTLARPVARHQVVTRTLIVLIASETLVLLVMLLSTWAGLRCCTPADAPPVRASTIGPLAASLGALTLCWGGLALAVTAAARRRAVAAGIASVAALAAYLTDYLARVWDRAAFAGRFSPFRYFEPMGIVSDSTLNTRDIAILLAIATISTALAYAIFSRRDL